MNKKIKLFLNFSLLSFLLFGLFFQPINSFAVGEGCSWHPISDNFANEDNTCQAYYDYSAPALLLLDPNADITGLEVTTNNSQCENQTKPAEEDGEIVVCCCCEICGTVETVILPNPYEQAENNDSDAYNEAQAEIQRQAEEALGNIPVKLPEYNIPELQIDLPIDFGDVICETNDEGGFVCTVSWIGDYVSYIYRYGLSIAGILAAIMLMAGGVIWLTSGGDSGKVGKAKELIIGSITGLLILFSAYLILYQINPNLTTLNPLTIGYKDDGVVGDSNIPIDASNYGEGLTLLTNITGIECGVDSYSTMIAKSKDKITYSQTLRSTAAPDNKIYLDCSSFASYISACNGKSNVPAFTGSIFSSKNRFNEQLSSLREGDLVGWPPTGGDGHVYIYLGNGRFGDVNGFKGGNVGNYDLDFVLKAVERHTGSTNIYINRP